MSLPSNFSVENIACVGNIAVVSEAYYAALDRFISVRPNGKNKVRVLFPKVNSVFIANLAAAQCNADRHADIIVSILLGVAYLDPAELHRLGSGIYDKAPALLPLGIYEFDSGKARFLG